MRWAVAQVPLLTSLHAFRWTDFKLAFQPLTSTVPSLRAYTGGRHGRRAERAFSARTRARPCGSESHCACTSLALTGLLTAQARLTWCCLHLGVPVLINVPAVKMAGSSRLGTRQGGGTSQRTTSHSGDSGVHHRGRAHLNHRCSTDHAQGACKVAQGPQMRKHRSTWRQLTACRSAQLPLCAPHFPVPHDALCLFLVAGQCRLPASVGFAVDTAATAAHHGHAPVGCALDNQTRAERRFAITVMDHSACLQAGRDALSRQVWEYSYGSTATSQLAIAAT